VAFAQRAAAALVRVHEVLGTVPAVMDPNDPVPLRPGRSAEIHFDRVGFGYGSADAVLRDLELHVDAGTSVAIVGTTGSGKSTIARLLLRFYDPDHGSITLGGVDLRDLRLADLRSAVGVVFEDTLLFSDTVAANIAFALPDADLDTVRAAARLAGADEFIAELTEGYDTLLGERGYSLSGGQRQRIAIARAIVADPQVLVLDDATSAVDPSKEHEIRDAMRTVMAGRTTVIIAHRPATIALADRVVLLDEGRIVASGTDAELRRSSPRYREVIAAMDEELGDDAGRDGSALDGSAPEGSASTESEHGATGWS
jgi:ATP-binding cassette subfamily B protein